MTGLATQIENSSVTNTTSQKLNPKFKEKDKHDRINGTEVGSVLDEESSGQEKAMRRNRKAFEARTRRQFSKRPTVR